jgi:hypothetical protein
LGGKDRRIISLRPAKFTKRDPVLRSKTNGGGKVVQIIYTHVSKCKNDKIKLKKKKAKQNDREKEQCFVSELQGSPYLL